MPRKGSFLDAYICLSFYIWTELNTIPKEGGALAALYSVSKTTKLILLDSLLQEVCISSGKDGSLTLTG